MATPSSLRGDAEQIWRAAIGAVAPQRLLALAPADLLVAGVHDRIGEFQCAVAAMLPMPGEGDAGTSALGHQAAAVQ